MDDSYEEYEKECNRIRSENEELLKQFSEWLSAKGLSDKTVQKHCRNMNFYLNQFLLYEEAQEPASGVSQVGLFLGDWFISKAMWSSQTSIKENAASFKKFYTFMYEKGLVEKFDLDELKEEIKECLPEWLETMARYDDPDCDIEDVWR